MVSVFGSIPWLWQLWLLNAAGMTYFFLLSLISLLIGLFITLPDVYRSDPETLYWRKLLAVFFYVSLILNFACLKYYSRQSFVRGDNCVLPKTRDWTEAVRTCRSCEIPIPPRARHCTLCRVCVLKRDHHCFFVGSCVGFHNQRYFITFCFYSILGAFYSAYSIFAFLSIHYVNILSSQFYQFLFPWLFYSWLSGVATTKICALVIFGYLSIISCFGGLIYFGSQCLFLYTGQTSYEYTEGIQRYRYPLCEHILYVFGPLWVLNFVVPLPCLKSPHNGRDWRAVLEYKQL